MKGSTIAVLVVVGVALVVGAILLFQRQQSAARAAVDPGQQLAGGIGQVVGGDRQPGGIEREGAEIGALQHLDRLWTTPRPKRQADDAAPLQRHRGGPVVDGLQV